MSAHGLRWMSVTVKPVRSGLVESLPLAALGDFVRGRNSAFEPREAGRQACPERSRRVSGLFESLLAEAFA